MKKIYALIAALVLTIAATGQTLNVRVGDVIYQYPASQVGDMTFSYGNMLTIMDMTFAVSDIDAITVDETEIENKRVIVEFGTSSAKVYVPGDVARYVSAKVEGAHVTIDQSNTSAIDDEEITYQLSGSTANGSLTLSGSYKCTVTLAGVTLTNPNGAAINITNSKRIHRSYIINLTKIQEVNKNRVVMDSDTYLPIGDLYKDTFQKYISTKFLSR